MTGQHKGHPFVPIEAVEARQREAELARLEAAISEIDADAELSAMVYNSEMESAADAQAAMERYFERLHEVVAQRKKALSAEINRWKSARADRASGRQAKQDRGRARVEESQKALQQSGLSGSELSAAVEQSQKASATATMGGERLSASSISFVGDGDNIGFGRLVINNRSGTETKGEPNSPPNPPAMGETDQLVVESQHSTPTEDETQSDNEEEPTDEEIATACDRKMGARIQDEVTGCEWFASVWAVAIPRRAVRHGAPLRLVNGKKLTRQVTGLPDWAVPPPKSLQDAIIAATGASDIEWDPQGALGPSITLMFQETQPFMHCYHSKISLYLGYQ